MLVLDGFTGFTPVQMKVVKELLAVCSKVLVTVTMDVQEPFMGKENPTSFLHEPQMIRGLCELTKETEEPVWIKAGEKSRFAHSPALSFMEKICSGIADRFINRNKRKSVFFLRELR